MKFICDQMLSRIGKWLRAAGHDTAIVTESISDREILERAISEERLLITRDRHFLSMKRGAPLLHYLKSNDFDSCMDELNRQIRIDWLFAPFSRCMICNHLLDKVTDEELLNHIPSKIRHQKNEFWHCSACRQYFWEGTHTQNMRRQLNRWAEVRLK